MASYSFGQWLKWRRETLDLTQKHLAQRIGCSEITLRKLEAGERRPSLHIAQLIAEQLAVTAQRYDQFLDFARAGQTPIHTLSYWTATNITPTNLSAQIMPLIGREGQVLALCDKFRREDTRLLTLAGPPGVGKTRLANEVASRLFDVFEDGVYFVALDKIESADLIPSSLVTALGVSVNGSQVAFEAIQRYLRERRVLLVLDNFEHVATASALITDLLAACPFVCVLVTSRTLLRLRAERHYRVPPLELPPQFPQNDNLLDYSAIALFVERAQAVRADFELTAENSSAILDICTRLDGLPLAIELIAAYVKLLSPQELVPLLSGRFMLHSQPQVDDLADQHQTLITAIGGSYELLPTYLQQVFMRLSVFLGGWTLEAAQAVCEQSDIQAADRLVALLDRSLIQQEKTAPDTTRFKMLMPIREYAAEQLTAAGLSTHTRDQHSLYFCQLAKVGAHKLWGPEQLGWLQRLDADYDNLRAALDWCEQSESRLENHVDIISGLEWYWILRGRFQEGYHYVRRALQHNSSKLSVVRQARVMWVAMNFAVYTGDIPYALANIEALHQIVAAIEDKAGLVQTLFMVAMLKWFMGDFDYARTVWDQRLALAKEIQQPWHIATSHYALAMFYITTPSQRDLQQARTHAEYYLLFGRQLSNHFLLITSLITLAYIELLENNLTLAQMRFEEGLTYAQQLGDLRNVTSAMNGMAKIALRQADPQHAQSIYLDSLRIAHESSDKPAVIDCVVGLAQVFKTLGLFNQAAVLLSIAQPNLGAMSLPPVDQDQFQQDVNDVCAQLGEAQFSQHWEIGKQINWEQVSVKTIIEIWKVKRQTNAEDRA